MHSHPENMEWSHISFKNNQKNIFYTIPFYCVPLDQFPPGHTHLKQQLMKYWKQFLRVGPKTQERRRKKEEKIIAKLFMLQANEKMKDSCKAF